MKNPRHSFMTCEMSVYLSVYFSITECGVRASLRGTAFPDIPNTHYHSPVPTFRGNHLYQFRVLLLQHTCESSSGFSKSINHKTSPLVLSIETKIHVMICLPLLHEWQQSSAQHLAYFVVFRVFSFCDAFMNICSLVSSWRNNPGYDCLWKGFI